MLCFYCSPTHLRACIGPTLTCVSLSDLCVQVCLVLKGDRRTWPLPLLLPHTSGGFPFRTWDMVCILCSVCVCVCVCDVGSVLCATPDAGTAGLGWCGLSDPHLPSLPTQVSLHRDGVRPNPTLQDRHTLICLLWGMTHTLLDSTKVCACGLGCA